MDENELDLIVRRYRQNISSEAEAVVDLMMHDRPLVNIPVSENCVWIKQGKEIDLEKMQDIVERTISKYIQKILIEHGSDIEVCRVIMAKIFAYFYSVPYEEAYTKTERFINTGNVVQLFADHKESK